MDARRQTLVFTLDEGRYALSLGSVERVVPVSEIDPLPKAPPIVLGVINVEGRIIPVVDVRKRLGFPLRDIALSDRFILARTRNRPVALLVDTVTGLLELPPKEMIPSSGILPGLDYVEGVAKLDDGLVFIHNLDTFLSLEEGEALEAALADDPVAR